MRKGGKGHLKLREGRRDLQGRNQRLRDQGGGVLERNPGDQCPGWPGRGENTKTPQSSGRERVGTLPPEPNVWALGQFHPWHHLPGKQSKDGSKVTRSHWEALSSRGLLGCPPSDLGYFGNCAARIQPRPPPHLPVQGPVVADDAILSRNCFPNVPASGNLSPSPNCLRASSVWAVPSALRVLGPGIPHQMPTCHSHLHQVPEHPLQ